MNKFWYLVDNNKFIKGKGRLTAVKENSGWSEIEWEDLGELYISNVPKYKVKSGKVVERTEADRDTTRPAPTEEQVLNQKKIDRVKMYNRDSDGLFYEWQLLEATGATQGKIDTAKQAWIDKVTTIKEDIPL